jgi:hypothetical protein
METKTSQTILLDVYERLGVIETELKNLNKSHDKMEAEVDELMDFKKRVSAYIWLGGSLASGILFFLYEGLKWTLDKWLH